MAEPRTAAASSALMDGFKTKTKKQLSAAFKPAMEPTDADWVGTYVDMTGLTSIPHHLDYYRAFSCFRMASILQGVYKRSTKGQASSADGAKIGKLAGVIAQLGGKIADRYEKQPDRLVSAAGAGSAFSGGASGGRRGYSTSASAARRGLLSTGRRGVQPTRS